MKAMVAIVGLILMSVLLLDPELTRAQQGTAPLAQPGPSPAPKPSPAQASPSPAAKVSPLATPTPSALGELLGGETGNRILVVIGGALIVIVGIAWVLSNRQESAPSAEQLEHIREFVEGDFARHVAHGLLTEGAAGDSKAPSVASDPAWQKVFSHQLDLHNEFYRLSKSKALEVYAAHIDEAVSRHLAALREQRANA